MMIKCCCIVMFLLACPGEHTRGGAAALFIQNIEEKADISAEKDRFSNGRLPPPEVAFVGCMS